MLFRSSNGVGRLSKIERSKNDIEGTSWKLPLSDDESLQPLYRGIPLPKCALEAVGIDSDEDGSYQSSGSKTEMKRACQTMAAWKLCGNGPAVSKFAARGGPDGSRNPRKTFGAELADPYANSDDSVKAAVDEALRVVASAMTASAPNAVPAPEYAEALRRAVVANCYDSSKKDGVASSLAYLRDRIGVPRDLPLASARYLRAYLNWAIDSLSC